MSFNTDQTALSILTKMSYLYMRSQMILGSNEENAGHSKILQKKKRAKSTACVHYKHEHDVNLGAQAKAKFYRTELVS